MLFFPKFRKFCSKFTQMLLNFRKNLTVFFGTFPKCSIFLKDLIFAAKSIIFRIVLILFSKYVFFNFQFNFDRALALVDRIRRSLITRQQLLATVVHEALGVPPNTWDWNYPYWHAWALSKWANAPTHTFLTVMKSKTYHVFSEPCVFRSVQKCFAVVLKWDLHCPQAVCEPFLQSELSKLLDCHRFCTMARDLRASPFPQRLRITGDPPELHHCPRLNFLIVRIPGPEVAG